MTLTLNMPFGHELTTEVRDMEEAKQILDKTTAWTSFILIGTRNEVGAS